MTAKQTATSRLPFIDAIKAIASQLIVLHHLAFYGPMSDYAKEISPALFFWLSQHARIAVQAFLVIGGFLAAQALMRCGKLTDKPIAHLLWQRYLKLVVPYLFALLIAVAASVISRQLMTHDSISATPTLTQFIAHILLLHDILDVDGFLAGAWYVAIDFQLYALLLLVLWIARRIWPGMPTAGWGCLFAVMSASLFYFNRDASWDSWAIYFVGAYGLGAITYWGTQQHRLSHFWLIALIAMTLSALWFDYRSRILVALLVACGLILAHYMNFIGHWPRVKFLDWLGKISYSVFLTHFSICLIINAIFERFAPHTSIVQFTGMGIAWIASILGGAVFYRLVENPAQRRRSRPTSPI